MESFSKQILRGGTKEIINKIGGVSNNQTFVVIVCLILAAYSARVSQGYTLPTSLYPLFDNIFAKIISFIIIIVIAQFNKQIAIMLILSYVLLIISYYNQNGIEGFEDVFFRFTSLKNIENFTSNMTEEEHHKGGFRTSRKHDQNKESFSNMEEEEEQNKESFSNMEEEEEQNKESFIGNYKHNNI